MQYFCSKFNKLNFKYKEMIFTLMETIILIVIFKFYGKMNYNRENEFIFPIIVGILIYIFSQEEGILSKILKKELFR